MVSAELPDLLFPRFSWVIVDGKARLIRISRTIEGERSPNAFPETRYQGSKAKLVEWIWSEVRDLPFDSVLDCFGGTGAVGYRFKQAGKEVVYNDQLRFNYRIGQALIENPGVRLGPEQYRWLLERHDLHYSRFIEDTFDGIYFTSSENRWLDQTLTNIRYLEDIYQRALAFFALAQAALIKRPYNLFHRKNLYMRLADVPRSFGNKATWDKKFSAWFQYFAEQANRAVFSNGRQNRALMGDALDVTGRFDLVYIDPPYISSAGSGVDYRDFYHFLEGMTLSEDEWRQSIDWNSKHRRLKKTDNPWHQAKKIGEAFDRLYARYQDSILVVSYRTDGVPSESEMMDRLRRYKKSIRVAYRGPYQYVLSKNKSSQECLFIAT